MNIKEEKNKKIDIVKIGLTSGFQEINDVFCDGCGISWNECCKDWPKKWPKCTKRYGYAAPGLTL